MNKTDRSRNFSRKEARLAVDRAMGLSLLACVGGILLRRWPLHRLAGFLFLGLVGAHLAQHEKWLRPKGFEEEY